MSLEQKSLSSGEKVNIKKCYKCKIIYLKQKLYNILWDKNAYDVGKLYSDGYERLQKKNSSVGISSASDKLYSGNSLASQEPLY